MTIDYRKFYKTVLGTYKADEVVNRFQEDQDLCTYNAKMRTINKIVKEMTSSKQVPKAPKTMSEPKETTSNTS